MKQRAAFFSRGDCVLDVGCGPGYLAGYLTRDLGCTVVGVDGDERLLQQAGKACQQVYQRDLERDGLKGIGGTYTAVFFGDVIEHVRNASVLLLEAKTLLAPGGRIIISTPNFVHVKNRIRVLFGNFEYRDSGLLDRTHVHFYTRASLEALIREAGCEITRIDYTTGIMDLTTRTHKLLHWFAKIWPELFAYQFIVEARPRS